MLLLVSLLLGSPARAAEVTDIAPALHGDLRVAYRGRFERGSLREGGEVFGTRREHTHRVSYTVEFAYLPGLAGWVGVHQAAQHSLRFDDAWAMGRDPATDQATYQGSAPLDRSIERVGAGLEGAWLGVAVAPFETMWSRAAPGARWRFDAGVRFPAPKQTFWDASGRSRGVAPGGVGVLLQAAFSVDREPAEPYLVARAVFETPARADVTDDAGAPRIRGARVKAADTLEIRMGGEITAWRNDASRVAFDLSTGFGYAGWAQVPSGVLLPDVLPRTETRVVASAAYMSGHVGAALLADITQYATARFGVRADAFVPRRLEDPYPVVVGADTTAITLEVALTGRFR